MTRDLATFTGRDLSDDNDEFRALSNTDYADWVAGTAYSLADFAVPTVAHTVCFECTTAGTSGTTEPTWDTTAGNTTPDGTVTWTCRSYSEVRALGDIE